MTGGGKFGGGTDVFGAHIVLGPCLDFRGLNLRERVQVVEMAISMFASERGSAKT